MAMQIKSILFDLGDTLLDFGKVNVSGLFRLGARLTYDYLCDLSQPLPSFAQYHRRQLRAFRWRTIKSRITGREFNALDLVERLTSRMGHHLTGDQMLELAWLMYLPLSRRASIESGVRRMLADFTRKGLTLGVISNTCIPGQALDRHLQEEHLLELLPMRVYSCDVGFRKPSRAIFLEALKRTGVHPAETMFVGNSLRADIRGANRVGMVTVLKDPANRHRCSWIRPAHRIRQIVELQSLVAKYDNP